MHVPRHRYTYREYLELEDVSNVKHEYFEGEIYARAGGTPEHAALAMAVGTALSNQLHGGPCRVFSSDLRVRSLSTGLATYPDVTVVCGELERDPEGRTTVTNPKVVVEVLSDGTEDYDRGEKLEHYFTISSVHEVVLVSHRERRIDVHRRDDAGALSHSTHGPGDRAVLASVGCALEVDAIYGAALGDSG